MKKQWFALLCFGVSACTPLSGVNGNNFTHSSIQNPQPHGKVMNTADQKNPLTVRDGWFAFLPNEPSVVTGLQNHADAGVRSAYYTRLTQALSVRSAAIAVADAKAFLAQGGGYVYLARGDETSNPDYLGYMIYGDERVVGNMPVIPVDVSPETKRKYPAGVAPDQDLHATCPKNKRIYVQGTGIQNTYPNELANSAWASLSSAAMLYGRAWNRAMTVACIDEVARSKPILPENSQVRFSY